MEQELIKEIEKLKATVEELKKAKTPDEQTEHIAKITEITTRLGGDRATSGPTLEDLLRNLLHLFNIQKPVVIPAGWKIPEPTAGNEEKSEEEEEKKEVVKAKKKLPLYSEYQYMNYNNLIPNINIQFVNNISELLSKIINLEPSSDNKYQHYFVVGSIDSRGAINYIITPRLDFSGELQFLSKDIQIIYLAIQDNSEPKIYCRYINNIPTPGTPATDNIYYEITTALNTDQLPYIILGS